MNTSVKYLASILILVLFFTFNSSTASAGLLDEINNATRKLNQTSQQMQQNSQGQSYGTYGGGGGGSLSAALGATNLHGLDDFARCENQSLADIMKN